MIYAQLLFLLLVANGAPIMAQWVLGNRWNAPLDCGARFIDGHPLLGSSKSFRGVIFAVCGATLSALLLGLSWDVGFRIGLFAMVGDSLSSFIKRRWGMMSGGKALGVDQVPESALPLLSVREGLNVSWMGIGFTIVLFCVLERVLSLILFRFHLRKHPY